MNVAVTLKALLATSEDRLALNRALVKIIDEASLKEEDCDIPVEAVLSHTWSPEELEETRQSTDRVSTIRVSRFIIEDVVLYEVGVGNAETELARELKQEVIRAHVCGTFRCRASAFVMDGSGDVYSKKQLERGDLFGSMTCDLPKVRQILSDLGIEYRSRQELLDSMYRDRRIDVRKRWW